MTPPLTPQAFVRSLKDRAANAAKIVGVPAAELVDRYYHRRLLARVFEAGPDSWILKGGQALLVRWPQARYSVDVDLLRTSKDTTVDSAVDALVAAASVDLDDHLTFSHYDTSGETTAGRPTRKVRFEVRFGLRRFDDGQRRCGGDRPFPSRRTLWTSDSKRRSSSKRARGR